MQTSRRTFLEFMGRSVVGGIGLAAVSPLMGGCYSNQKQNEFTGTSLTGLQRSTVDDLVLADGLKYHVLAKWTDVINSNGDQFGAHCDYVSYIPFTQENPNEGYLWVNHEYFDPTLTSNFGRGRKAEEKTLEQIRIEQKSVGGSILHVKKSLETGAWAVVPMSAKNRRFDALTEIPFSGGHRVFGSNKALGTLGNCCGGQTPWGTFLTCEENYSYYYGSEKYDQNGNRTVELSKSRMAWDRKIKNPPEHYGWVCEIDPRTHKIVKHPSLGRFAHEGAKVTVTSKQQAVVYMGDDAGDEHFYKFIADRPGQLVNGKLYVARMNSNPGTSESGVGEWVEISLNNPLLKGKFKNHTELMVRTRDAAKILGATPLDRPEGCDIDPLTKNIFLACTNNSLHARNHGYVLKVKEEASAFEALRFEWEVFVKGGGQDEM
ncbi:MAG: PhoX family protein, partial [Pseudobdellovibrionaceae bacterium]